MGPRESGRFTWASMGWRAALIVMIAIAYALASAQNAAPASPQSEQRTEPPNPALEHRPLPKPQSLMIPEGKIRLDVVADDAAGKPVIGLQPWDFKILDNGQSSKVMSFRSYDGVQVKPDPPVEVILVVDTVNLMFQQLSFVRGELDEFLRQNGGQLQQPLTLALLTEKGIRIQPRPSTDGNAIATMLSGVKGSVRVLDQAMGFEGQLERFQVSERALDGIVQNEARKPGRKLLIWVGWGWPMLNRPTNYYSATQQHQLFSSIVEMSTVLREAQVTVYSVSPAGVYGPDQLLYQNFLKGVKSYKDADFGDLALKVLATQTGGKIMGPDNDVVGQLNHCIEDAGAYYRISFNPPVADHADEYHDLKVQVDRPGVTVRTTSGYYNEPAAH
jgi:VWFA-related protein